MERRNYLILTGQTEEHLINYDEQFLMHKEALGPFLKLQKLVSEEFDLKLEVLSTFRSFGRQKFIWNQKASGKRLILDDNGNTIDPTHLNDYEMVTSIMRWSALPGFSRHHWGTDFDVFDESHKPEQIELVPEEYQKEGPFYQLNLCLEELIENDKSFGFFRPYHKDLGGVAIEPWHLSYKPVARQIMEELDLESFEEIISKEEFEDIKLIDVIRKNAEELFYRFISL